MSIDMSRVNTTTLVRGAILTLTAGVLVAALATSGPASAQTAGYAKTTLCIACHKHAQGANKEFPAATPNWEQTKHATAEGEGPRYHFNGEDHVTCQACHGPGMEHVKSRKADAIHLPSEIEGHLEQLSVCARCHAQYEEDFLEEYTYGEDIMGKITLKPATGESKLEQVNEMIDSKHYSNPTAPTCVKCHTGHNDLDETLPSQIRKPILELCTECHTAEADLSHSKYETIPEGATCATCHMPEGKHLFAVPAPQQ